MKKSTTSLLFWSKVFYFCYFAAIAALLPYLALYYDAIGLNGRQIGLLASLSPLVTLVAAPFWGSLADASQRYKLILSLVMLGAIGVVMLLSVTTAFLLLIGLVVLYAAIGAPIVPLTDSAVMGLLAERKGDYGKQRLWGAVGWGASAPLIGRLIESYGQRWSFWGFAIMLGAGLLVVQRIPFRRVETRAPFWQGAQALLANRHWLLFLSLVFAGGMGLATINNFLLLHMQDLGASQTLMGFTMTTATLSELPMYFYADRLLARWRARGLLVFALLAFVVRAALLSFILQPWWILVIQLLHGATFSSILVSGVSYADQIAPPGMSATAQGLFSSVLMGLGASAGALLGGFLFEALGGAGMYFWMGTLVLFSLGVFLLVERRFRGEA